MVREVIIKRKGLRVGDISYKTRATQAVANSLRQHLRLYSIKMKAILF